jgi:hypothetical protein
MSRTVFILGAGASKEGGAPLMANFLDVARDQLDLGRTSNATEDFERVFRAIAALKIVHSNSRLNIENIETLFAACEMAKTLKRFPQTKPEEIDAILISLRRLIVRTLELTLTFPLITTPAARLDPPEPYKDFAILVKQLTKKCQPIQTVSIITFNYDIAADFALVTAGVPVWYALEEPRRGENHLPLLKLHGSMSWGYSKEDPTKVIAVNIGKMYNDLNLDFHDAGNVRWPIVPFLERANTTGEPVLVPPTWNKADSHRSLEAVWSQAAYELSEAENIFVMGYSMPETDSFFRHLFALGTVGTVMLRRFWVFNPDAAVEERFRGLLGPGAEARFEFNPDGTRTFRQAIEFLAKTFPSKTD